LSVVKHTVVEAMFDVFSVDETTGLAFSPDGTKMYAALQDCYSSTPPSDIGSMCLTGNDCGCLFEFTRTDGQTFDGSTMGLNSLTAIGGHDRQFFDKLLWGLVTSTIFVRW